MSSDERGYTLAELVLVMMIFSVVMALISVSFSNIVKSSSAIMKSAETDIGGLIGLELLRSDLEAAGLGLPWSLPRSVTVQYDETHLEDRVQGGYPGTAAKLYNDSPPVLPKAYEAGDQVGFNGSDYLVLKGSAVGMSRVSRSWGYLNYSSGVIFRQSKSGVELDPGKGDRVIVLRSAVESGVATRELVTPPGSSVFTLPFDFPLQEGFLPKSRLDSYLVYGVAPQKEDDEDHPLMLSFPYNRADYYLNPSGRGSNCAPNTGVLYKTTIDHNGGATPYPILDCVADLQVLFYTADGNQHGELDTFQVPGADPPFDAAYQRAHLKEVRVYVLAQQGKMDPGYNLPMPDPRSVMTVGKRSWTASEFLKNGWEHYRWKVYSIVVQPKNL